MVEGCATRSPQAPSVPTDAPRQSGVDSAIASARPQPLTTVVLQIESSVGDITAIFQREGSIHHADSSDNGRCRVARRRSHTLAQDPSLAAA